VKKPKLNDYIFNFIGHSGKGKTVRMKTATDREE
jgi:hypothetical protein